MPDPSFPWQMFLQAQEAKNRNHQQSYQDIQGIGQGLGQGLAAIGQAIQEKKKKDIVNQLLQAMRTQGAPQQGPQMPAGPPIQGPAGYTPPGAGPSAVPAGQAPMPQNPASGMGAPAQDNSDRIKQLMMAYDPQAAITAQYEAMSPYKNALTQQALSEAEKNRRPNTQKPEFQPVPGMLSNSGKPLIFDKFTGKMQEGEIPAKSTNYGTTMGPIRQAQYTIQDLPSNQGPTTAGGAAYQVKVAARQGMNLIAKPGSPQRSGLAQGDLARSILRNAPTDEAMRNANFSDNLITRWTSVKQRISADPASVNNPQIRKEMYDIFQEMDKSATPFIQNQLDDMSDAGFPVTPATRKRQLGELLPNIPFQEAFTTPISTSSAKSNWSYVGPAQ